MTMSGDAIYNTDAVAEIVLNPAPAGHINVTNFTVHASGNMTATFTIVKNSTVQDGSGVTINTTCTMSGTSTCGPILTTVTFAPGDRITVRAVVTTGGATAHWSASASPAP